MKIRKDINLEDFFKTIRSCKGRVVFRTTEDDVLNMKSQLCLFVFAANYIHDELLESGELVCELPEDEERLKAFAADSTMAAGTSAAVMQ